MITLTLFRKKWQVIPMYTIEKYVDNYEVYELTDDDSMSFIKVVPARGGIIAEFSVKGREIFYLSKETLYDPGANIRGGNPIMFPVCGKLEGDRYFLYGKEYTLHRHGFARMLPWEVSETGNSESAYIVLKLRETPETLQVYPFEFELAFKYELKGSHLKIHQEYKNNSKETMPFYAGFHPYFLVEDVTRMEFKIQASRYLEIKTGEIREYYGNLDYNQEIDVTFLEVDNFCSIHDTQRNLKINLQYSDFFKYINFWRINSGEFVCVDPCMASENAMNSKKNIFELGPGESLKANFEIWTEKLL